MVFCHGLLGFDSVTIGPAIAPLEVTHWRGIKEVLQSNGVDVLITRVPATSSPIDRAHVLAKRISEVYPGKKIHLIGLSPSILCHDGLCTYTQALIWRIGHSMVSLHPSDTSTTLSLIITRLGWFGLPVPHNTLNAPGLFCPVRDDNCGTPPRLCIRRLLPRDCRPSSSSTGPRPARLIAKRRWRWKGIRVPYD